MKALFNSINGKLIVIGLLILAMLIPVSMVESLVYERQSRKNDAIQDVTSKWGKEQSITGPVLTIPYKTYYLTDKKERRSVTNYLHILPENLNINGDMTSNIRQRGMYEIVLYNTKLTLKGNFPKDLAKEFSVPNEDILWSKAQLSLGLSDMTGIQKGIESTYANKTITLEPGTATKDIFKVGVSAKLNKITQNNSQNFQIDLDLNGSEAIYFTPLGKQNSVKIKSDWPSPSFNGAFIPQSHNITEEGFTANWEVLHLNRNYPQSWTGSAHKVYNSEFGFNLYISADIYQQTTRSAKYAILFILFSFIAFFCAELIHGNRVHPFQYLLVGLAISIFYTLLLSLSEHLNFDIAYFISAVAIISLIIAYARSFLTNQKTAWLIGSILSILYLYFYILLQLEDFSLLVGSIGLFIGLALIMYTTRKIDWYNIKSNDNKS